MSSSGEPDICPDVLGRGGAALLVVTSNHRVFPVQVEAVEAPLPAEADDIGCELPGLCLGRPNALGARTWMVGMAFKYSKQVRSEFRHSNDAIAGGREHRESEIGPLTAKRVGGRHCSTRCAMLA